MQHPSVCGPLDVGDVRGLIASGPVPYDEMLLACKAALTSPAFDGMEHSPETGASIVYGQRTVVKVQHREHERRETALWFEELRQNTGILAPALLDGGTVECPTGVRWWLILERVYGTERHEPVPASQHDLGIQLRIWHELAPAHGLRLDDPGGLGVLLGTPRVALPEGYFSVSQALADVCEGLPMTAIHGDVAVGHNALFRGDALLAILDPGAVHVGPPMLDLAWCLAIDLPHGANSAPLLDAYGRDAIDKDALEALLPHMLLRRLVDTVIAGDELDTNWLINALRARAPRLLDFTDFGAGEP
jgi:aminoglycoside 3'-phosphotransferase II